ncbi:MAG: SPOR domain-containing protein [Novosphingobium sp.]
MGVKFWSIAAFGVAALGAGAALADVKAGVEAWSRGDYPGAVKQWQGPAQKGDADAQFNLGNAYRTGMGVKQDRAMAEALFAKAAAQGHLQAADLYGLILFDKGERQRALPLVQAAAGRGEPRAQYLVGIAHFNGDLLPKDWPRAYALVSLAVQGDVAQARPALAQMDQYIPLEQRQQGVALSAQIAAEAAATRQRQLAASDLGAPLPQPPKIVAVPPAPTVPSAQGAVAAAARIAGSDSPRTAGADYARPAAPAPRAPVVTAPVASAPVAVSPAPTSAAISAGAWRVQLGAFGVAANADALWNRVKARPELAGHPRMNVRAGAVIKLQAGGFASQAAAQGACTRLSAAGFTCIAVRN